MAGIAAAIRAVNPELSVDEVKNILISSAQKTLFNEESKKFVNFGLVNMKAALDLAQASLKDRVVLLNKENDEVLYDENLSFKYVLLFFETLLKLFCIPRLLFFVLLYAVFPFIVLFELDGLLFEYSL